MLSILDAGVWLRDRDEARDDDADVYAERRDEEERKVSSVAVRVRPGMSTDEGGEAGGARLRDRPLDRECE
jgi:hypothetical protein